MPRGHAAPGTPRFAQPRFSRRIGRADIDLRDAPRPRASTEAGDAAAAAIAARFIAQLASYASAMAIIT